MTDITKKLDELERQLAIHKAALKEATTALDEIASWNPHIVDLGHDCLYYAVISREALTRVVEILGGVE